MYVRIHPMKLISFFRRGIRFYGSKDVLIAPSRSIDSPLKYDQTVFTQLSQEMQNALKSLNITTPSDIQQLVIPTIMKGKGI